MILSFVLQYHDIKVVLMLYDKQNIICASVLLNVFNLLRKSNKMLGKASHFVSFPQHISQDILSLFYEVIQSGVTLHLQVHN